MSTPRVDHALVSLTNPASFAAEQYHGLGLKVERLRLARDIRVIGVTSPGIGDGKTVTAINLAAALARGTDARVLLVDADLRRPAITGPLALDIPRPDLPPKGGSHEEPDLPPEGGSHEEKGHGLADLVIDPNVSIQDAVRPI
ncbi:MAG: hypothetical protein HY654_08225, partial [Acidobacteria bacterium]|nr:hypothetical protein [Acidobacteriota bacterium]